MEGDMKQAVRCMIIIVLSYCAVLVYSSASLLQEILYWILFKHSSCVAYCWG